MAIEKITKLTVQSIRSGMIVKMYNKEYDRDVFARVLAIGSCNVLVPDNANYTPTVLDANMLQYIEEVYDNIQDTMMFYISIAEEMARLKNLIWKRVTADDLKSYMEVVTETGSTGVVIKAHYKHGECIIFEGCSLVPLATITDELVVQCNDTDDMIMKVYTIGDNGSKTLYWER